MAAGAGRGVVAEYAWEGKLVRTWETVKEGEDGRLVGVETDEHKRHRARMLEVIPSVRRGMIRYLYVILDMSKSMRLLDFKPTRKHAVAEQAREFVAEYFDQNPLSHLGLIVTRGHKAEKITDLSSNAAKHIAALNDPTLLRTGGEMSIQNALIMALEQLSLIPNYGNREILFIHGALSTCDPGDVFETLKHLKKHRVRVSFVSVSAELFVAKTIATETGGDFGVCLDQGHLRRLMSAHTHPPAKVLQEGEDESALAQKLVKMGFPNKDVSPGWCACHSKWCPTGYRCPRCKNKCCDVPTTCPVCGLHLVSSARLARSYHHLFPVPKFSEVAAADRVAGTSCAACLRSLDDAKSMQLRCGRCEQLFCFQCDVFIHDSLHNCPGCC